MNCAGHDPDPCRRLALGAYLPVLLDSIRGGEGRVEERSEAATLPC